MKKILYVFLFVLFVVSVTACGAVNQPIGSQPASQPTYTPYPTYTAYPTQSAPTESATVTPMPSPTATLVPPTQTLVPTLGATADNGTPGCQNHGTMAWNANNQQNDEPYGLSPVNGLSETCWFVAQTHWKENGVEVRAVFAVEPKNVAWLVGYLGGTGWYFSGTLDDVRANLAQQAAELEARDGKMKTYVIILPQDADSFPILDHVQQP